MYMFPLETSEISKWNVSGRAHLIFIMGKQGDFGHLSGSQLSFQCLYCLGWAKTDLTNESDWSQAYILSWLHLHINHILPLKGHRDEKSPKHQGPLYNRRMWWSGSRSLWEDVMDNKHVCGSCNSKGKQTQQELNMVFIISWNRCRSHCSLEP